MRKILCLAATALLSLPLFAATRLTYQIKGRPVPISWSPGAFPLAFQVDSDAATRLAGGQEAIDRAFHSWEVSDSAVSFRPEGTGKVAAGKDGVNSVSVNDDLFSMSGFLAFTTTWFDDEGRMVEADIQVDSSVVRDRYGVEGLVEHEVGHLLGLDHSAVVSATMYPFISRSTITGLQSDDRMALAAMYPATGTSPNGILRGKVDGATGPQFGAQVVALDPSGSPVASGLTQRDGSFELEVPPGSYKLYVEPLDGPVDPRNLSGVWRNASAEPFRTEFMDGGAWLQVQQGQVHDGLSLRAGSPSTLNPKWIGTFPPGTRDVNLSSTAASVIPGQAVSIAVGGDGFVSGMTTFEVAGTGFERVSDFSYGPNYVWAVFRISQEAQPGSSVVLVRNGEESAMLTGGLRVDPSQATTVPGGRRRPAGK